MRAWAAITYCFGISLGGLPAASRLPDLIHSTVATTGRGPTSTKTPSLTGLNWTCALLGSGWNPYRETGIDPTPSPAFVKASASASAALAHSNHGWLGSCGIKGLPIGYETSTPSGIREAPPAVRFSSVLALSPNRRKTITISFARLCASESSAATTTNCVFVKGSIPANHSRAGGVWLIPIKPTWRGSSTVCNIGREACSLIVQFSSSF